jgi:P-type Cu+ transporter
MGSDTGCGCGCTSGKKNLTEVIWSVPNIKCEGCAGTLEKILKGFAGIACVSVKTDEKKVALSFDATLASEAQLKDLLDKAGFPVARP